MSKYEMLSLRPLMSSLGFYTTHVQPGSVQNQFSCRFFLNPWWYHSRQFSHFLRFSIQSQDLSWFLRCSNLEHLRQKAWINDQKCHRSDSSIISNSAWTWLDQDFVQSMLIRIKIFIWAMPAAWWLPVVKLFQSVVRYLSTNFNGHFPRHFISTRDRSLTRDRLHSLPVKG